MVWSFLNTGKEALHALLNRFLAPYVEGLDTSQLQYGVWQGQLSLRGLKLKKGALDKFRLPVDVLEGYVGTFTLTIPWQNITGRPVEVYIEDVYLLAVPAAESAFDPAEDEARKQATKQERLNAAELVRVRGQMADASTTNDSQQHQGLIESITGRIVNNVQITVKNIHIRYEDSISAPGHPFSAGITLAGFTASSVDENWIPTFIQDTRAGVHKLAKLESLSAYFNTDMTSMAGLPLAEAMPKFNAGIAHHGKPQPNHQFILKPVTGEGRVIMNTKFDNTTAKNDVQLLFDEIGFVVDDNQYRDAISMVDIYHFYLRQQEYRAHRPRDEELKPNKARAMLQFAGRMILKEVHEKNHKWTWEHFAKRRDDRKEYVKLFKTKESDKSKALYGEDLAAFQELEQELAYEDIRFYRSIARSELRKERASRKAEEEAHHAAPAKATSAVGGWTSWIFGGSSTTQSQESEEDTLGLDTMSDEQRKELYQAVDYDEKAAIAAAFEAPRDAIKMRIAAQLKRGSFALRSSQAKAGDDMISVVFDAFRADIIQRPDNMDAVLMLGGFGVYDGTQQGSIHPQIVRVKESHRKSTMDEGVAVSSPDKDSKSKWETTVEDRGSEAGDESLRDDLDGVSEPESDSESEPEIKPEQMQEIEDPFLYVKLENNPLDERADTGLTVRMRYMEIVYHRGYVEAIYRFLKPPESQLESVGALLNAAGETLEGLRKETRAGLEYALQQHKTIDVKMDLQAPIIIIPEDVSARQCQHMILDAGHISIESQLVPKETMREIDAKKKRQYTDDDYTQLESLMYDRFSVKLHSAQLLLGNDLETAIAGLSQDHTHAQELHLLERINLDFVAQNTIVPDALNLAKLKVSGKLPELKVNLSNQKYKGLMRIIDVAIPHFGDDMDVSSSKLKPKPEHSPERPSALPTSGNVFSRRQQISYAIDDVDAESSNDESDQDFHDADGEKISDMQLHQHTVEFTFEVEKLQASLYKTAPDGTERLLANTVLEGFALQFAMAMFNMNVDISLRSIGINMITEEQNRMQLLTSNQGQGESETIPDLVRVKYVRAQKESPEFMSVYNGIDQSVDVALSTFSFNVAPEPVLTLYDFIMSTFVGGNEPTTNAPTPAGSNMGTPEAEEPLPVVDPGKIKVKVKLTSIKLLLMNSKRIGTLVLPSANVEVLLRPGSMLVEAKLGQLSLSDDSDIPVFSKDFKQLLTIEGEDLANFKYETFDPTDPSFDGINSSVHLRAGSLKLTFAEEPLRDLYDFLVKFARLKSLYDSATQAAVQRAAEISKMKFDVVVQSPILIFPCNPATSEDMMIMKLGEIVASNEYEGDDGRINAGLRGIRLSSKLSDGSEKHNLRVMEDVDITASIEQYANVDRNAHPNKPDTYIDVKMSDIRVALTQTQFCILMNLANSVPQVFATTEVEEVEESNNKMPTLQIEPAVPATPADENNALIDLGPEISLHATDKEGKPINVWTTLDLVFSCHAVKLHLFDQNASCEDNLKECGIARFALVDNIVRYKSLSDGASEAEIVLKSLTMSNTRPGPTKFREIMPAAQHDRNQFMILYSTSGGPKPSSRAIVTIDSPKVIFSMDPVFALVDFFSSPFTNPEASEGGNTGAQIEDVDNNAQASELAYRVDIHDLSVNILENDADSHSQAIHLTVKEVSASQQGVMALNVAQLGMSLGRMGRSAENVRFLDDMDVTLSLDTRKSTAHQMTSIELSTQPIVFRASYRDINLIMAIVNRAIELSSKPQAQTQDQSQNARPDAVSAVSSSMPPLSQRKPLPSSRSRKPVRRASHRATSDVPKLMMSKEKLKASFDGFRLVLIGDLHELPMLHLKTKPFEVLVSDWSGELKATTTFGTSINYWNLVNSHWEPLIDPWTFSISAVKEETEGTLSVTLGSKERLDLNMTSAFVELAINTAMVWQQKGDQVLQRARGGDAPYRIHNRTGDVIHVWSDQDPSAKHEKAPQSVKINDGEVVDWRFDDWKAMREHVSTTRAHLIGVQFQGKSWEPVKGVPVDREGEFVYGLRPSVDKVMDRLLCEITVKDNVKVITLRSTYNVENLTSYTMELVLVDSYNKPAYSVQKIEPGGQYSLPIEAVIKNRIKIRPDAGFGFAFSQASLSWEELLKRPNVTVACRHNENNEAPFRFQVFAKYDANDPITRRYPKMSLRIRAPVELENLLPYDIKYRVYDKNASLNWTSYLRRGGVMPVHSVELTHLLLLNIEAQDSGFAASSFAIINADTDADFDIEKALSLPDKEGRKLDIRLNYVRHPDSGGAVKIQIYSPFIMINKTGLPFALRANRTTRATAARDVAVGDNNTLTKPTPFMFSHSTKGGNEFSISVAGSSWSTPVNFESLRTETEIVMRVSKNEDIHVGISWAEGLGKYKLSKVVTLAPRFIVKNMTSRQLSFREHGVPPQSGSALDPNGQSQFMHLRAGMDGLLTFAYTGLNAKWSAPINIQDIGRVHLRMPTPESEHHHKQHLLRADVALEGSTIFIILSRETGPWPFKIDNQSDYPITISQMDTTRLERGDQPQGTASYDVGPHLSIPYAWDAPAAREKKIRLLINGHAKHVDINEIGNLPPFQFPAAPRGHRAVSLDVKAEGPSQTLTISNYLEERSVYKRRARAASGTLQRQDTISSQEAFEAVTAKANVGLVVKLDLEGIGLSLINKRMMEILYLSVEGVLIQYTDTDAAQICDVSLRRLQIDNQLHDCQFPIVLQPTLLAQDPNALPAIQGSLMVLKDNSHGVTFVKYASVLLQSLSVQLDEDFLFTLLDFAKLEGVAWGSEPQDVFTEHPVDIPEPQNLNQGGQDLYFEVLELQPTELSLSFMRSAHTNIEEADKINSRNPLAVVINAMTMALGNLNNAPLRFNALAIRDMRLSVPILQERIIYHYRQEVLRQLYRVLGSADFLGNPVGLFTNVSGGVADIFYEPYKGVVMHGNKELGIGIAKGAASFVKKTVFGVTDSMTKVTSSIGKGLSAATFDDEYQRQRRLAQRTNKPKHAIYGVTAGAEALATSIASGVEGVVMKPIEGAETGGASGFLKGIGKGLVGAVTKPVIGVFDLAANVSEGIRNTTTVFDNNQSERVRKPRHIPSDGILVPYSTAEAIGQMWMKDLDGGRFRNEFYVAHIGLPGGDNVAMLTTSRIMVFSANKLRLEWEMPFSYLQGVTIEDTGIRFTSKSGHDQDRFVPIPTNSSKKRFFHEIEKVVKNYSASKRIER
ncbi:Vacuolar protein sorting-associated protein 13 OS=Saccharomyces cerevisiae (strain ATCC 204508 / S288c) GN=VPS13 PE=1 SV=1 [Rhizoctonia solani AG-1 IB]|uniref:Vacuolar protein sorting-associated protein 13 n=1 Tax=Thanatephorus cucumeris (strain AG1-IB / isolate 7/3/14) TaxID=1108050 RepID=A0A0B7FNC7_THACB|nr:Vacuolar protein sorting-associated protein 13 OS=Saccharomyces cerevisiae (strain ATCC 204508 / S288c) GN=VPS13 PE=1 SV=1 [Rhizoctonia solani AG-1 IB]